MFNFIKGMIAEGKRINFTGGFGDEAEIIAKPQINGKGKFSLILQYPQQWGKKVTTGFVFAPEDFDPLPDKWETYSGIILCWKDAQGKNDRKPAMIGDLIARITMLNKQIILTKTINKEQVQSLHMKHTSTARKEDDFENAEKHKAIKDLFIAFDGEEKKTTTRGTSNYFDN